MGQRRASQGIAQRETRLAKLLTSTHAQTVTIVAVPKNSIGDVTYARAGTISPQGVVTETRKDEKLLAIDKNSTQTHEQCCKKLISVNQ